jgi:transcriptional regulator with XRE-family HTH domain
LKFKTARVLGIVPGWRVRREKGWSQEKLAEAAEMHRICLAGLSGRSGISLENLLKLANALRVSLSELFSPGTEETGTPRPPSGTGRRTRKR